MSEEATTGAGGAPDAAGFEQNLEKLEAIVRRLEGGEVPLDEALRLYEEGIEAYKLCQKTLQEADLKIRKLVETLEGELKEEAFEPPAGPEADG